MKRHTDTTCKDCIFATYKDITQIDCSMNRLDTFRHLGYEIIEAYDHDREFYVIKKKTCPYKRTKKWKYYDADEKDQREKIADEIRIRYKAIVVHNGNLDDLLLTVHSLLQQSIKPSNIVVILQESFKEHRLAILGELKTIDIPWRIENIKDEIEYWRAVDFAVMNRPQRYYAVFNAGCNIPLDMFEIINYKISEEILPIVLVKPNGKGDGLIALHALHIASENFRSLGILENTKHLPIQFPTINELCPHFPK